jgi:hypothetical protein
MATSGTGETTAPPRRRQLVRFTLPAFLSILIACGAWLGFSAQGRSFLNSVIGSGEAAAQEQDGSEARQSTPGTASTVPSPETVAPSPPNDNIRGGSTQGGSTPRGGKWCRFCRQRHPVRSVTCPDCGQMLTRVPARAAQRFLQKKRAIR